MNVRQYLSVIVVLSIVAPVVWLWSAPTSQARSAASSTVLRATLANGLRVVIVRNAPAPVASTAVNYLVGSGDPDYYPLSLGNAVLGGGFYATRLTVDLRENLGLV
jgi:predicted Zn-dependent peptidase